ncbi:unnamed protein product [Clavelina lepadiformis]|uniref:Uncharacterized protein n=1 Tax=Clavelina lepadiformis TaxID=159417 RepID=A0ABP0F2S6_CLALP
MKHSVFALAIVIIFTIIILIEVSAIKDGEKCTASDPRIIYEGCALDYRDMTLWCDLTNLTQLPRPEEIKAQAPPSKSASLFMNDSCVDLINPDVLGLYNRLKMISFSKNRISHLVNGTFAEQTTLKVLDLSNNIISKINKNAFQGAIALKILDLSHNNLSSLPTEALAALRNLQELNLASNKLRTIDGGWFGHVTSLKVVSVAYNKISSWMTSQQTSRENVPAQNQSPRIQYTQHISKLEKLSLRGNALKQLPLRAFAESQHLTSIDLGGNRIRKLHQSIFKDLCFLHEVVLNDNRLSMAYRDWFINVIRNNAAYSYPPVTSSVMSYNRWICDCRMYDYWKFLHESRDKIVYETMAIDLVCSFPLKHSGRNLTSLREVIIITSGLRVTVSSMKRMKKTSHLHQCLRRTIVLGIGQSTHHYFIIPPRSRATTHHTETRNHFM